MQSDDLSLEIAGGIMLAATVLMFARVAVYLWQSEKPMGAIGFGVISVIFWVTLVTAALGLADW